MKTYFLFAGLNLNTVGQEKNARHMHVSWMMHLKQGIKHLNVETRLLFAHLLKFPATRLLQRFYV